MRVCLLALNSDQHVSEAGGTADHIGRARIEGVEPVQGVGDLTSDTEGIDQDDELAQLAAGAGGDGEVLALEVQHEGGARIGQQVGDDSADTLAGPGGGARQDMAVLAKTGVTAPWGVGHEAEHKGISGSCRSEVPCAEGGGAELCRAVGIENGGCEQGGQEAAKPLRHYPGMGVAAVVAMAVCASEEVTRRTTAGSLVRNQVTPRRCPARTRRARSRPSGGRCRRLRWRSTLRPRDAPVLPSAGEPC